MKKHLFIAICSILTASSCASDDVTDMFELDCLGLVVDVINAQKEYNKEASVTNCKTFRAAIETYKKEGCTTSNTFIETLELPESCTL